jgi:uncharacterized protein (DUF58 family)
MMLIPPFHYQVAWQPRGWRPGEHPAAVSGDGGAFRGERLLADASQARFFSVRASMRDPLRRLWVRENQQRATLDVFVIVDVSGSMRVGGDEGHGRAAGDLIASAALSAYRGGDRIGVVCASGRIDPLLSAAPTRRLQPVLAIADQVRSMPRDERGPGLDSVDGMLDAWRRLSMRRSLVLLVSDFHAPAETWTRILQTLRRHQVVPILLRERDPVSDLPTWGLVHLDDAESGGSRTLLMRPSLHRRLVARAERRQVELDAMFEHLGLRPCQLRLPFDPGQLTEYFHAGGIRYAGPGEPGTASVDAGTGAPGNSRPTPRRAR